MEYRTENKFWIPVAHEYFFNIIFTTLSNISASYLPNSTRKHIEIKMYPPISGTGCRHFPIFSLPKIKLG